MLNLRIRPVNDDGSTGENTRVIATQQITYTGVFNSVSTISFDVSRDDWQPTAYPFVVRVEYSTGGRYAPLPEHDLFIIERDSDDSKDAGRIVTYQGIAYVPWILTGTYVGVGPWNVDGERTIDKGPANAGRILDYLFTESTSRGPWLKHLTWNFNGTRDSANVSWKTEDRETFAWRVDQHWYGEMLTQLADQSLCEWTVKGTELQLFRPGTRGVDRSESIQLGGPRFDRVPVETDTQGQFTHVISTYDKGRAWTTNTDAEARFGRRSVAASHTGVKTAAASQRLSQKLLAGGQVVKREEAYEWTPTSGDVSPFRDFSLGDLVSAVSRGSKKSRRVIGVIITQSADGVTVQARVGERISTLAAKNKKALEAVTGGSIPGGTGGVFPTVPPVEKPVPKAPAGLVVVSNVGRWKTIADPVSDVKLQWQPVTMAEDDSETEITEYEVWSRLPADFPARVVAVADPSATISSFTPGAPILVSVRARNKAGWGEWSTELQFTPQLPLSVVPKAPTGLAVATNVGAFTATGPRATVTFGWSAVTKSVDDVDISADVYRVWVDGALHAEVESLSSSVVIPSQVSTKIRVSVVADGRESDRSATLTVTGALPAVFELDPTAPVLSSSHGNVRAVWNGLYTTAAPLGAHTVRVEARVGSGAWVQQGAALTSGGEQLISVGAIGDTVEVRLRAFDQLQRLTGTSATASIGVQGVEFEDTTTAFQDWILASGTDITASQDEPTEHAAGDFWLQLDAYDNVESFLVSDGTNFVPYVLVADKVIAAGSVTAHTLNAEEIYANEAHMNALSSGLVATDEVTGLGNSLNITANESIELAVGRQDATDQQLSELREDVDGSIDAATQAATVADVAHIAALAAGADLVAQNSRLAGVESGLSDQQAHFKILPNGVQVAFDNQSASLDMTPQSIRFMSQGTAVAEISQEAIIIHKGIFEQAQIGNHLMQKKGNRTTFTPIEGS